MIWHTKKKRKINPETGKREYKKKSPLKRLTEKANELAKEAVRLRDDWTCQICGKKITIKTDAHTMHIVGRKNLYLKWDLLNLLLGCFNCHQRLHGTGKLKEIVKEKWPVRYDYLYEPTNGNIPPRCHWKLKDLGFTQIEWLNRKIMLLESKIKNLKES